MTTTDLFNNPSNDYINPGLAPCANAGDDAYFKFIDGGAGVVIGSDITQFIDLSNINIPVTSWTGEKKLLQSGEVTYVPGLSKGLLHKTQVFDIPNFGYENQQFFMILDISVNHYYNFRYYNTNIDVSSSYELNIDIDDAMNISLSNNNVFASVAYDASSFTFSGNDIGYDFDITSTILTLIDASMDANSPIPAIIVDGINIQQTYILSENLESTIPSSRYPNGAMLGYILKTRYPADSCNYEKWINMNHVESPFETYKSIQVNNFINDISIYNTLLFDPSIQWNPFVNDISILSYNVECFPSGFNYDPSYGAMVSDITIDNSIFSNEFYSDSSISNCTIYYSRLEDSFILNGKGLADSSIYGSDINTTTPISSKMLVIRSFISDSSLSNVDVSTSFIQYSYIANSFFKESSLGCLLIFENSSIFNSYISNTYGTYIYADDAQISNITLLDSSIYNSVIIDSSIITSIIQDSSISNDNIIETIIENSYIKESKTNNTNIINSDIYRSFINLDSSISDTIIENSWINAYEVIPGLWTNDVSCNIININNGIIHDTSINNVVIYDASIYTSNIYNSSLFNCTLYNTELDSSTTTNNCTNVYINAEIDASLIYTTDSSLYYQKYMKIVDVGRNGSGDEKILSASEYLDYINTHNMWDKVGPFASRFSAPDNPTTYTKNLIGGFYLFNPHPYEIMVEYMCLNFV